MLLVGVNGVVTYSVWLHTRAGKHAVTPAVGEYVLGSHVMHSGLIEEPVQRPLRYWPATHAEARVQLEHCRSVVRVGACVSYSYEAHTRVGRHLDCPAAGWNVSGGHGSQLGLLGGREGPEHVPTKAVPGPQALAVVQFVHTRG